MLVRLMPQKESIAHAKLHIQNTTVLPRQATERSISSSKRIRPRSEVGFAWNSNLPILDLNFGATRGNDCDLAFFQKNHRGIVRNRTDSVITTRSNSERFRTQSQYLRLLAKNAGAANATIVTFVLTDSMGKVVVALTFIKFETRCWSIPTNGELNLSRPYACLANCQPIPEI